MNTHRSTTYFRVVEGTVCSLTLREETTHTAGLWKSYTHTVKINANTNRYM